MLSVYKYKHSWRSLFDSTKMATFTLPIILWSVSRFLVTAVKSVVSWNPQIPSGSWNTAAGYQPTSEWHTITPLHGLRSLSYKWQQNICKIVRTTFYTHLYNGYWVFPGVKERPGHDADPSPPSSAVVKKG